jgi:hypothetical protein
MCVVSTQLEKKYQFNFLARTINFVTTDTSKNTVYLFASIMLFAHAEGDSIKICDNFLLSKMVRG